MRSVCVYCGSSRGHAPAHAEAARRLGTLLAERGMGLVYGGGDVGLMGVIADTVLQAGGQVTGVIPRRLLEREVAHLGLTRMVVVDSMHERKAQMAELADGFIALPGGLGTLDELFEVWTWGQLGIHAKPIGLLDVNGFFQPLLAYLDHAVAEGFIRREHRDLVTVHAEPAALLDAMAAWQPRHVDKWHRPPAP